MNEGLWLRNLSARYRSGPDAIHSVSCTFPRGQITAILGPNGSGKSTLLKAILGLIPARGTALLDGQRLEALPAHERGRQVAYVPQRSLLQARLRADQVVEQGRFLHRPLMTGLTAADREAMELAFHRASADHLKERIFTELSGGEQQRVLLARALATEAQTLLLDEPTAALDARQKLLFHQALRALADTGHCIGLVLHDLDEVHRHSDRAVLLKEGMVHREGSTSEVMAPEPVLEVYGVEIRDSAGLGVFLPKEETVS